MLLTDKMHEKMDWPCYADASEKFRVKFRVWQSLKGIGDEMTCFIDTKINGSSSKSNIFL